MNRRVCLYFALLLILLCVCCFCSSAEEENRIVVDHVVYQLIPASEQTEAYYIVVKLRLRLTVFRLQKSIVKTLIQTHIDP